MCMEHFLQLFLTANPACLVDQSTYSIPTQLSQSTSEEKQTLRLTNLPALNFLQFTILTCQVGIGSFITPQVSSSSGSSSSAASTGKGAGRAAWQALLQRYEKEVPWLRAPQVKESTARLGEIYFGIKSKTGGGENMLANLMGSLFGGGGPSSATAPSPRRIASPALD